MLLLRTLQADTVQLVKAVVHNEHTELKAQRNEN